MIATIPTTVGGVAVKSDDAVETPLSTAEKPMHFTRIRRLTLVDDTEHYACMVCGFTADTIPIVRGHLGRLHQDPDRKKAEKKTVDAVDLSLTLGQLLTFADNNAALLDSLERVSEDRNEWRARARRAEGSLAALRKALA